MVAQGCSELGRTHRKQLRWAVLPFVLMDCSVVPGSGLILAVHYVGMVQEFSIMSLLLILFILKS